MKIIDAEYNDYLVGFVITTDKGDINAQFEKVFSNHPEPNFELRISCTGDDTGDHLNGEEREQIAKYIKNNDEMSKLSAAYTDAYYNGSNLPELIAPISDWQITERAFS